MFIITTPGITESSAVIAHTFRFIIDDTVIPGVFIIN
jgi:hypothetical protein